MSFSPSNESLKRWQRSELLIAGGVQTLSKAPDRFVKGVYPYFLARGKGATVWDDEDNAFTDYPLALGAITLGHADVRVNTAAKEAIDRGVLFTLPTTMEADAAEWVLRLTVGGHQVRFAKTGSEVCSAAVKLARAVTGREHLAVCGYHGWHDWYTVSTEKRAGIPGVLRKLVHPFPYNDLDALRALFAAKEYLLAAVIMEPCIYEAPDPDYLERVKELCTANGALLILDEMVTGGRFPGGSAQRYFAVEPDISCFGKGIANGFPLAALVGKETHLRLFNQDCFFSTTFGGETVSLAASIATLQALLKSGSIEAMWRSGRVLQDEYNRLARTLDLDTESVGYPSRTMFMFPSGEHKSLFWQECVKRGVLFGYAQFISLAHDESVIYHTLGVVKDALQVVKRYWDAPLKALEGPPAKEVFRLVATRTMART